ncbi:MAG: penicillin-binding protein [Acidobacteria bacterium]|nr:MAG: penicillin-binding protein [Acidobacteriota bacterium]
MAIKIRIPNSTTGTTKGFLSRDPVIRAALVVFVTVAVVFTSVFSYYYLKYDHIIDQKFKGQVFSNSAKIYAIPETVQVGEKIDAREIAVRLRRAAYAEKDGQSFMGSYRLLNNGIEIKPGPDSYHSPEPATIRVRSGKVESIAGQSGELSAYELEPQMITALFDAEQRSKRQLVKYDEIPKVLVDAVLAIEDRRFFQHGGVNFIRLAEAAWIDLTHQRHEQGGSTITMQLSRAFFLTPEKTVKRKIAEMLIAMELEQKFTKRQIFEFYANRVDVGQRGSFTISGFAAASQAYFNKDLKDITLPEAALIAGLVQAPSYLSPYRHPERALERRNVVLDSMVETHAASKADVEKAKATPLKLAPPNVEASDAPYFVDLVRDTVIGKLNERELNDQSYRIYTTLDPELQKIAAQAVETGMKLVDDQVTKLRTRRVRIGKTKKFETKVLPGPQAQLALVAMDPHTGEVLALVGGRNYGTSQLNHATSRRPTGSVFKPFVYAAAMNTAVDGTTPIFTPASMVDDQPTTFSYGDQIYEPRNYKEEYHGQVTARYALATSLNNATVKLAEEVGYDRVADLAKAAGITSVKATPAMALGAYDATPIDVAAAYTVFANAGVRLSPIMVNSVRNARGDVITDFKSDKRQVLDPRVAFLMTNMMEGVLNFGTGFPVRTRGFNAPAAGKTGSSHDGWFAGYTSNLLCIVWVGYDDYSDIRLSGAQTAAPIWAEFMKKAVASPRYSDVKPFSQPTGVVDVQLDKLTNLLANASCPETYTAAFIAGTEPSQTCDQGTGVGGFFSRMLGIGGDKAAAPPGVVPPPGPATEDTQKKKGLFGKIVGIFKDDKSSNNPPSNPQPPPPKAPENGGNGPQ